MGFEPFEAQSMGVRHRHAAPRSECEAAAIALSKRVQI